MGYFGKVMRFIGRILKYSLISIFILLIAFFIAIQTSGFQTYLGQKASAWLSDELKTEIRIEKVDIDFFNSVLLKGVYVQDLNKDTLLYGAEMICDINDFSYSEYKLDLDQIELKNMVAKVITYKGDTIPNYQFLVDYFAPTDTISDSTKNNFKVNFGNFKFTDVDLVYADRNDTIRTEAMNFSDLNVRNIYGLVSDLKFEEDTILFNVKDLSLRESCGFNLENLSSMVKISPMDIKLDSLYLKTDKTLLRGKYYMLTNGWESYSDYLNKVYMYADLKDSCYVSAKDIAYFVPELLGNDDKVLISGIVKGTVTSLTGKNLNLQYGTNTRFYGDFNVEGLPDLNNTYLHFDVKQLSTTRKDLIKINVPPFNGKNKLAVPENIGDFGLIQYKGKIDGLINDIAAYGTLKTSIGSVRADIGISNLNSPKELLAYHGKLKTQRFHLGTLLDNKDIGDVSMDVDLKGKGIKLDDLDASLEGNVSELVFKGYTYKQIKISGDFKKRLFNGKFESKDEFANFDFYGSASFVNKIPELDFIATVNKVDFSKLHLFNQDSASDFSSQISILLTGDNIDKLTGRINFDNTIYKYQGKEYKLSTFDLNLEQDVSPKTIKLNSGVADVRLNGDFNLSNLGNAFTQVFSVYYPTFVKQSEEQKQKRNYDNFDFRIKVKKLSLVNGLFLPDLMIAPNTIVEGKFDASNNSVSMTGNSDKISYKGTSLSQWKINVNSVNSTNLVLATSATRVNLSDSVYLGNFVFDAQSLDKKSSFGLNWDNQLAKNNYAGKLNGTLDFTGVGVDVLFEKIDVMVADSSWVLSKANRLIIDSTGLINFNELELTNNGQQVSIQGLVSKNPKDQLMVKFTNFKLKQLNPLLASAGMDIDGSVTGTSNVSDIYNHIIFSSALDFTKLSLNGKAIGSGEVNSYYDKVKDVISLTGSFKKEYAAGTLSDPNFKNLYFAGYYYPNKKEENIDIDCNIQTIDIAIIQPFVKGILTFGKGYISGNAKITGNLAKPIINGKLSLESVRNLKVDYLNTYYTVSGNILLEPDRIAFEGLTLFDINARQATVWGNIFHDNFKNIKLDFDITTNKFMVLNTNPLINPDYYGKAFVTGNVGIWGSTDQTNIEVNMKTEKGTQFNIPLGGPAEVADNEFITFIKKDTSNQVTDDKNDLSGLNLMFNLEATPDAEIQLIFDEKAGDVIKATGRGNINMDINSNGTFEMFGTYTINDGSYLFTLENFINKKFDVETGSTIKWSGNPYNAEINITANYKQRASLAPFFPVIQTNASTDATGATAATGGVTAGGTTADDNNKRYPVECKLYMRDKLLTPEITFGIALPTVTEEKRQQVMGYINNEQELNRQVFSLLLLKSFVAPLALSNQSGVNAGNAVGANASEMLSNQLSNWLSQLATNIDVGVNYTPGSSLSNEELDLALSTQLMNDKLSIDGNVGLNNNTQTKTSNVIGDINVDYKLTDEGKVRVKAFNRSNDTYQTSTAGGQFTQGLGVFFREEFESIDELYRRYLRKMSRKKAVAPTTPSS
jgi:hypothetical protein